MTGAFIYQRGPYNNMTDSSAGLTVRQPCDWLTLEMSEGNNYVHRGDVSNDVVISYARHCWLYGRRAVVGPEKQMQSTSYFLIA